MCNERNNKKSNQDLYYETFNDTNKNNENNVINENNEINENNNNFELTINNELNEEINDNTSILINKKEASKNTLI